MILPAEIRLTELAEDQQAEPRLIQFCVLSKSSLIIRKIIWGVNKSAVYCDLPGYTLRPPVKVTRHIVLKPAQILAPESRFRHIHMDIVGPLPECEGYKYILTVIDRFSRWTEAIPLRNIEATAVWRALFDGWVARFGSPETLTTDQGRKTTPYHPASNGMIERFHSALKAAIVCQTHCEWTRLLSNVILGLRTSVLDCGSSPAEYLHGMTLRILGEFVLPDDRTSDLQVYLNEFRAHMRNLKPIPVDHRAKRECFVSKSLIICLHVFLRVRAARKCQYSGPHRVIRRIGDRVIEIDIDRSAKRVSLESVKPAFGLFDDSALKTSEAELSTFVPKPIIITTYAKKSTENLLL
ncbi:uncharacterized protein K02A2.6-like [Belonocnema kinseyi]|uniref:uncharacterized protein K02A2.6-like n=1 Tax=Belonocnema kinseyi TaxID=2817044 RepID=UPI00143CF087|nr:uncharacterized protein K02A2.6-like [Belonocnema kinseyi]